MCWRAAKDEERFMSEARKWSNAFLTYCGVVAALVICSSLSLALVINAAAGLSQTAEIEKTLLDYRVESSREIRQALSKPIPRPEPLGAITAKLARSMEATKLAAKPKLSNQARDAFASAELPAVPSSAEESGPWRARIAGSKDRSKDTRSNDGGLCSWRLVR